ncbi:MAG: molybdopterin-dependent oxidoreductase, partial [Dehalococcoidia bacterium]|nr:molybdopterin-dependent oxidoreductase [Dehalococcoidia bacterium]
MVSTTIGTKKIKSYCALCGSMCPIVCSVRDGVFTAVEADKDSPRWVPLCPKGVAGSELVYDKNRLKYPMKRTSPKGTPDAGWERISWDEALNTVARKLSEIKARYGAESIAFCRPGPGGSPAGDFMDWLWRLANAINTPNTISTTHVCQWHRDHASNFTYGKEGIGVPDITNAAGMLFWGANPFATAPKRFHSVVKAQKRGAKLLVIDPRRSETAARADLWLQLKPGTDAALAMSLVNFLLTETLFDKEFALQWTNGPFLVRRDTGDLLTARDIDSSGDSSAFVVWDTNSCSPAIYNVVTRTYINDSIAPALEGEYQVPGIDGKSISCDTVFTLLREQVKHYSPTAAAIVTGVPAEKIQQAGRMLGTIKPFCYHTYTGIEQSVNATYTNRAVAILYALTGNYDSEGGNLALPATPSNRYKGIEFLPPEQRKKRLGLQTRPLGPASQAESVAGVEFYNAILTGKPYSVKALVSLGGNLIMNSSQSAKGREALNKLEFYVHGDLFLTPSAELADIVLPISTFFEGEAFRAGFRESVDGYYQYQHRPAILPPLHESRPDMEVIFDLATRLEEGSKFWNGKVEEGLSYMLKPSGLTLEQLRNSPGGVTLNIPISYKKYKNVDKLTGEIKGFQTPSGKVEMFNQKFKDNGYSPLPVYHEPPCDEKENPELARDFPLTLIGASLLQYCHGQQRSVPSLRKSAPHPFVEIHPETAEGLSVKNGDDVRLETPYGSILLKAKITDKIAPGVV